MRGDGMSDASGISWWWGAIVVVVVVVSLRRVSEKGCS